MLRTHTTLNGAHMPFKILSSCSLLSVLLVGTPRQQAGSALLITIAHYSRAWAHSLLCVHWDTRQPLGHLSSSVHRLSPFQSCTTKPLGTPLLPLLSHGTNVQVLPRVRCHSHFPAAGSSLSLAGSFPTSASFPVTPCPALTTPLTKQWSGGGGLENQPHRPPHSMETQRPYKDPR